MQYKLYNDDFDVIIDSKGCEIISVVRKQDSKQYIWNGNPDAWKRHTPVLFPLVGRYKNDTSVYKGKEYHMTQHGFARDSEFIPAPDVCRRYRPPPPATVVCRR